MFFIGAYSVSERLWRHPATLELILKAGLVERCLHVFQCPATFSAGRNPALFAGSAWLGEIASSQ
jgi:hypothetical protein